MLSGQKTAGAEYRGAQRWWCRCRGVKWVQRQWCRAEVVLVAGA